MIKINNILNNSFSKNTIQYVFGIGLAQLIAFAFQFILRRIYTQEDFGHYAIFTSIVSIITVVSTLRYERAILLPKENIKAYRLLVIAIFFAVTINLLIFVIILTFPGSLAKVFNVAKQNVGFFYLIPISGLLFSIFRVFEFYLTRKKAYLQIGGSKVIRRLTEGLFQYLLNFTKKSGLFLGDIIGHLINFLYGLFLIRKDLYAYRKESIKFKETLNEFKDFPKYNLWTALAQDLNTVFLPVFLISYFFGTSITGNYDLARLLLSVPLSLITVAIQQILFQKLSEMVNE
ncbi:MAG: oligosaccharide flippase family protein, partial [Bacteroidales bacterium]|nr:oligosaccharide flippase family protein [Bacteroidales bacterium]